MTISRAVKNDRSLDFIRSEISKCVLVCSNCHREAHNDMITREQLNLYRKKLADRIGME